MKIISKKNECYVQGEDLQYLKYNEELNKECRYEIERLLLLHENNEYFKIDNEFLKAEILQNENIMSFAKLYNMPISKLCSLDFKLLLDVINLDDSNGKKEEEHEKEKRRIEHLRKQINDMIQYKLRKSKCNFPNIENPCLEDLTDGKYSAALSLDYDKVLVHSVNNNKIDEEEINSFCDVAYKFLMRDKLVEDNPDDVNIYITKEEDETLSVIGKYVKVKKQLKKNKKPKDILN